MKASMESTNKTLVLQGLNFRVWEGVTAKGTKFIALVNRLESADPAVHLAFVQEVMGAHKEPDAATAGALDRLGVNPPPAKGYGDEPAPPTSTAI